MKRRIAETGERRFPRAQHEPLRSLARQRRRRTGRTTEVPGVGVPPMRLSMASTMPLGVTAPSAPALALARAAVQGTPLT